MASSTTGADELDGVAPLELPTDRPRPAVQTKNGATAWFTVPADVTAAAACGRAAADATLFTLLAAACQVLFAPLVRPGGHRRRHGQLRPRPRRRTGPRRHVRQHAGAPRPGRRPAYVHRLPGHVRDTVLDAFAHQDVPFEQVVDAAAARPRHQPLTAVPGHGRAAEPAAPGPPAAAGSAGGGDGTRRDRRRRRPQHRLRRAATAAWAASSRTTPTCSTLARSPRMAEHLEVLLAGIAVDPARPVGELPLLAAGGAGPGAGGVDWHWRGCAGVDRSRSCSRRRWPGCRM